MATQEDQVIELGSDSEVQVDISPKKDGSIMKTVVKVGTGEESPCYGCKVKIHSTGYINGDLFHTTKNNTDAFEFEIGKGIVLKGLDIGIKTMKRGEIANFIIKPEYGYGDKGNPLCVPPHETVLFQIELIDWNSEDLSPKKDGSILRTVIEHGEGHSSPNDGSAVKVHISLEYNGDQIIDRDLCFTLGEGSENDICEGIEIALRKMKRNEKSRLHIKSKYAFKSTGNPALGIPPNTDLNFVVCLVHFERLVECWAMDAQERLKQAQFFKDRGSTYFVQKKLSLAEKMYKKGMEYTKYDVGFSTEEEKLRVILKVSFHLNLSLCYLKAKRYVHARTECNNVLELDPNNEKAIFRRGQSFLELNDPEPAKADFERVLLINKNNKQALHYISICTKKILMHKKQAKQIYNNMFDKFAKHDKEKEEEERKQLPDVMKTLGEWGQDEREREPTEFEKENPNILMLDGTGDFKNM